MIPPRIFYEDKELTHVKCPREYFPALSLRVCISCKWHTSIQLPPKDPPYVVCHLEGEWYNAALTS